MAVVEVIGDAGSDAAGETLDSEGNLLMLKIDTYVKYGQVKEAAQALEDYIAKQPHFTAPRSRLISLYDELLQAGERDRDYLSLKKGQQQFLESGTGPGIQPDVGVDIGGDFSDLSADIGPSLEVVSDF